MSFKTTHTGSLPRPADLLQLMFAREAGEQVDEATLDEAVERATAYVIARQKQAGVTVIGDGEMSKPSYATYVKDRLSGFGGSGNTFVYQDLADFPKLAERVFGDPGRSRRKTPACNAAISVRDPAATRADVANLKDAAGGRSAFMSAASPGVVSLFFRNEFYPDHEAYLYAIADAMRFEYEVIADAGFVQVVDGSHLHVE